MSRLIDADRFRNHLEYCVQEIINNNGDPVDYKTVIKALDNQPTIVNSDELERLREDCKALCNRCRALTEGSLCMFCRIKNKEVKTNDL